MFLRLVVLLTFSLSCGDAEEHCSFNKGSSGRSHRNTDHGHLYSAGSLCHGQNIPEGSPYKKDASFKGVYTFPVRPIPVMQCSDPDAFVAIENGMPVVLHNCSLAQSAYKWNVEYILKNLRDDGHPAYISTNRRFLYYDVERIKGEYADWQPPQERKTVSFQDFMSMVREIQMSNNGTRSYFQSPLLVDNKGVSESFKEDIRSFDYPWLLDIIERVGWGTDVVNLLLVGMPDVVTPTHYDILENFYVQISGLKRVILFSPDHFRNLYPFPVAHPHDRQTQVNFDEPDFHRFPRFKDIEGLEAVLGPGEVLYLPSYWWHYIESETNNMTVSLNFWFEPKNVSRKGEQARGDKKRESETTANGGSRASHPERTSDITTEKLPVTKESLEHNTASPVELQGVNDNDSEFPEGNAINTGNAIPADKAHTENAIDADITKGNSGVTKGNDDVSKASDGITKENADITKGNDGITKRNDDITKGNDGITKGNAASIEQMQGDEDNESESPEENSAEDDETETPKHLSPAEYLALTRAIETSLFKATYDHRMVRKLLDEILNGRFDFLDSQQKH